MTELTKERREELRSHLDSINWPYSDATYGELRALLDMADERDRYRALLEEAQKLPTLLRAKAVTANDREGVRDARKAFHIAADTVERAVTGEGDE